VRRLKETRTSIVGFYEPREIVNECTRLTIIPNYDAPPKGRPGLLKRHPINETAVAVDLIRSCYANICLALRVRIWRRANGGDETRVTVAAASNRIGSRLNGNGDRQLPSASVNNGKCTIEKANRSLSEGVFASEIGRFGFVRADDLDTSASLREAF